MTKKLLVFAAVLLLGSLTLNAQQQKGGFTGPGLKAISVKEAKGLKDDTPVLLQGKILRSLGNEKYLFSDNSETITIEIDDKLWGDLSVSENDKVEISGEVDKERFSKVEIEVNGIRKL